jgi:hypothetical protein
MVRGFFLGALPFSGEEFRDVAWLAGRSISYDTMLALANVLSSIVIYSQLTSTRRRFVTALTPIVEAVVAVICAGSDWAYAKLEIM